MKIICTQAEKDNLVPILASNLNCPFPQESICTLDINCRDCVINNIEWEIIEE